MNLHTFPEIFTEILTQCAEGMGISERFIEKDYWLTTVLKQLALSPYAHMTVFKAG